MLDRNIPKKELTTKSPIRICACIDMDAFYAQVEARRLGIDDSVPLGTIQYQHLIAVNYAAQAQGVKRGMTGEEAKKHCPDIVLVHVDTLKLENIEDNVQPYQQVNKDKFEVKERHYEKMSLDYYRFESDRIFSVLIKNCNIVEKASIDESFLDLTTEAVELYKSGNYEKRWVGKMVGGETSDPTSEAETLLMIGSQIVERIRKEVKAMYNYACSGGISHNKLLCKLASGMNKPNGQAIILDKYTLEALKPLKIKKLRNFGRKIGQKLEEAGHIFVHQALELNLDEMKKIFDNDEGLAKYVYFRMRGFDDEQIQEKDFENKSLAAYKSFKPTKDKAEIEKMEDLIIKDISNRVEQFYDQHKLVPGTISLGYYDIKAKVNKTRACPINLKVKKEHFYNVIREKSKELLKSVSDVTVPCWSLGISVRNFQKSDIDSYEFDLMSYAKQKNKELLEKQNSRNTAENQEISEIYPNANECMDEELIKCDRCGQLIRESIIAGHLDQHVAEDLDRELNPNKKKYKATTHSEHFVENDKKIEIEKSQDLKKVKKTGSKEAPSKHGITLDKFFAKKQ